MTTTGPPSATCRGVRLRVVGSAASRLVGQEFEVSAPTAWIGRNEECDVAIEDSSMSRRHAELTVGADGTLTVRDNKSANGVIVNGRRVEEARILPGHLFTLGGTTFELVAPETRKLAVAGGAPELRGTVLIPRIADLARQLDKPRPLGELGETAVTAANQPFVLDDPEAMWVVVSGKVEIFTVVLAGGRPSGARTHFLTVTPGQAFFGLDTDRFGHDSGFLAVGKAGSQLHRYSLDQLQMLAAVPAHRGEIAGWLSVWVEGLSRRLTRGLSFPSATDLVLTVGERADVTPGQVAATAGGAVWIEVPPAYFLYDGMAGLSYDVEGVLFPLAPGSWIELLSSDETVTLEPRTTVDAVRDARLWAGLDAFHRVLCECEFLNKRLAHVDEFLRLEKKAEQAEAARDVALGAIGSVLGGAAVWERAGPGATEAEPVIEACRRVARHQGIEIRVRPDALPDRGFEGTLHDVATASRFRTRRVKLTEDWWRRDQGAFLGQWEESGQPVALLPKSARSYELFDPVSGEPATVDEDVAGRLSAFAHTFYTPFPDGVINAQGLIRFGLRGLGPEFRTVAWMGLGIGLLSTVTPLITGKVFDSAIPQAERTLLVQFSLGIFLVALATSAFKITQNVAILRVQGRMDYAVQAAVWDRLLDLPLAFFRNFSSGDLADRAGGVDKIRQIVAGAGVSAILGSIASFFNAGQMAFYSFPLAAVGVLLALIYVAITVGANYAQLRLQRNELERRGRITGLVLQLISGVAKLRVSGAENHAFRVWATDFAGMRRVGFNVGRIHNFVAVVNSGFTVLASTIIFFTMATLKQGAAERGETLDLTTGDFLAFSAAFGIFLGAMQALGDASLNMLKIWPIFERLRPLLSATTEVDDTKAAPGRLQGGIEVSHVHFRYTQDGPLILRDVSIKIRPGEFVAFVGGSGSGKSTLMRIMLGFEKPEKGTVYYDGQDLSTLDLRLVRQQLGVVLQDNRLLPADVYRNIVGAGSRTLEEAWEAARKAGIADDIKAMPMGMHTYVSEGGGGLSGGQKQRLMIARALVNRPQILYLDEATSALDNRTQAIVTESMNRLQATRIVIAHRLSTVVNADRICYLEEGRIVEEGSYDELMEQDGLFARLARRQLA